MTVKQIIKYCLPFFMVKLLRDYIYKKNVYTGNYKSWQEAKMESTGYDESSIFERVRDAANKVKSGEALFERDAVCFYEEEYRWQVLACLLSVALKNEGRLIVLDFGGSLGSFYYQHKKFLSDLKLIKWCVVEQEHYVECGNNEFKTDVVSFYSTVSDCSANHAIDVVLLSSVLTYLESPWNTVKELSRINAKYMIIDRTLFSLNPVDRLTIQKVPESTYKASYPAWILSRKKFNQQVRDLGYRIITEFNCDEDFDDGDFKGYFLEKV